MSAPVRRVKPVDLEPLFREIEQAGRLIDKKAGEVEVAVGKLDRARLKPEALRADERAIRNAAAGELDAILRGIGESRTALERQAAFYVPSAIRFRAKFDSDPLRDATIGGYTLSRLSAASVDELQTLATEAASTGSLALAVAIEREVLRRNIPAEARAPIFSTTQATELPAAETVTAEAIASALRSTEEAERKAREIRTGKSDPMARVAAAYAERHQAQAVPVS